MSLNHATNLVKKNGVFPPFLILTWPPEFVFCQLPIAFQNLSIEVLAGLLAQEGQLRKSFNNLGFLQIDRLEQAKVQVNVGKGGAFPCHFDLPSSLSAKRLLTVLLYLNPEWTEGDGGEVELFPFPFQDAILEPLHQRLVAFSSCTSLHRVRPFVGNPGRVCLNLWFEGKVLSDHSSFPLPDLDVADSYDPRACNLHRGCWHLRFSVQFQYVRYWFFCCWYGTALILYVYPSHAMDVRTHLQSHYCTQT